MVPIYFPRDMSDDLDDVSAMTVTFTWKMLIPSYWAKLIKSMTSFFFPLPSSVCITNPRHHL